MTRILPHDHEHALATRAVHAGQREDPLAGAVMPPIYQTSTYRQEGIGKHKGYEYARTQNPTREVLERNIAALEGATHGFAFGSGLAALDALLKLFRPGDHVVSTANLYGGSHRLMTRIFEEFGLQFSFVDSRDPSTIARAIGPATKLIYCETPTNPMMFLTDLRAVGDIAAAHGLLLAVDNTFATPVFQRPLELGAQVVLHSTTKYLNGHSDMVGGILVTSRDDVAERLGTVRQLREFAGGLDPEQTRHPVDPPQGEQVAEALVQPADDAAIADADHDHVGGHPVKLLGELDGGGLLALAHVGIEAGAAHVPAEALAGARDAGEKLSSLLS